MGTTSQKLTYLNDTKTLLRTNINAIGGSIDNDTTFRSYADELDNMWENLPHTTGTGTTLSLSTKKGKAKVDYSGNTYQYSTTGKNLLGLSDASTYTTQGITYSVSNGLITLSGTAYDGGGAAIIDFPLVEPIEASLGTLTKSLNKTGTYTGVQTSLRASDAHTSVGLWSNDASDKTGTLDGNAYIFRIQINNNTQVNCTLKPQVEVGSTATTWEEFTNGPSPNPDFPQKVETAKGSYKITTCKKNLCNPDELYEQMKNISSKTTKVTTDNRNCINFRSGDFHEKGIYLTTYKENTQYTFRFVAKPVETFNKSLLLVIMYADGTKKQTRIEGYDSWDELRAVSDANKTIDYFYFSYGTTVDWYIDADSFNIIEGETTSYELFQGDTYNIDLPVENKFNPPSNLTTTFGIGGVRTLKVEDGKFYIGGTSGGTSSYISLGSDYTIKDGDYLHILNNQEVFAILFFPQSRDTTIAQFTIDSINKIIDLSSYAGQTISRIKLYVNPNQGDKQYTFSPMILNGISRLTSFTPYGTTPIKLCKIGDYKDGFVRSTGKNIFDIQQVTTSNTSNWTLTKTINTLTIKHNNSYSTGAPLLELGTLESGDYICTYGTSITDRKLSLYIDGTYSRLIASGDVITLDNTKSYSIYFGVGDNETVTFMNIQLEKGNSSSTYEPYGNGEWYLKKEIGEIIFNGSEDWKQHIIDISGGKIQYYLDYNTMTDRLHPSSVVNIMSNIAKGILIGDRANYNNSVYTTSSGVAFRVDEILTIDAFKTYLGTTNAIVYYVLATPTYTKLTNTTLINQLENAWRSNTYDTQTNISQVNNDLAFNLSVTALESEE